MIQKMREFIACVIDHAMEVLRSTDRSDLRSALVVVTVLDILILTAITLLITYAIGLYS